LFWGCKSIALNRIREINPKIIPCQSSCAVATFEIRHKGKPFMSFISEVIEWYKVNKRDLPWRQTTDPYIIWLSEVILQQTRVDQGLPYFNRFVQKYPKVSDFANASEDEILQLWQGLGYYSRGRNMHKTAQMVMEDHAGYFPKKYDELLKLKGIGEYTAAAISSFSANEVKAVIDGNVFRVLSRYFGIDEPINSSRGKKLFSTIADEAIDRNNPALSNQAIMEFGALHCKPKNPLCGSCPLRLNCVAFQKNLVGILPVKLKKVTIRKRYFNYFIILKDDAILLKKRIANDIWQNLYELPLIETFEPADVNSLLRTESFKDIFGQSIVKSTYGPIKHQLSHQIIFAQFIVLNSDEAVQFPDAWFAANVADLDQYAQPQLIFSFLKKFLT
jgi:A/G-specific adenine glycosylase